MAWVGWEESGCDCLVLGITAFFNDERNHLLLFPSLFQLISRCVFMTWGVCVSRPLGASLLSLSYYETCNHKALLLKLEHLLHADFFCLSLPALWFPSQYCLLSALLPMINLAFSPFHRVGKGCHVCLFGWCLKGSGVSLIVQKEVKLSVYSLRQSYV